MQSFIEIVVLAATYFVEWIPNGVSSGEFPWQL